MDRIYLDHNSTTFMDPRVKLGMVDLFEKALNPSSVHSSGRYAKSLIENSRIQIANSLQVPSNYSILFTSSGTEANNIIIQSFKDKNILISSIEHLSIYKFKDLLPNVDVVDVNKDGIVDLEHLERLVATKDKPLVSIMLANNETGVIQKVKSIAEITRKYNAVFHSDISQAIGKIDVDISDFDIVTISSHKFGGPLGAGALIYKDNIKILPHIQGGGQERGLRSGTENVPAIVGFGIAATLLKERLNKASYILELRDKLELDLLKCCNSALIISRNTPRLPNTSLICMPYVKNNLQLVHFDLNGIEVSSGSACSSGKVGLSHVLKAMQIEEEYIESAVRVSLSSENTLSDVEKFTSSWLNLYNNSAREYINTASKVCNI